MIEVNRKEFERLQTLGITITNRSGEVFVVIGSEVVRLSPSAEEYEKEKEEG